YDLVIIGAGPAGLTAGIYASRMGMKTLILERVSPGGRAVEAPIVENFPGFPEAVSGAELVERMIKQAEKFGAEIRYPEEVLDLVLDGRPKITATRNNRYESIGILISTGTQRKKLSVPGETTFLGRGVSYCTICDGPLFKGKVTAVVGSGNEAFEDAIYLSDFAEKVVIVTGKQEVEAAEKLVDRSVEVGNIETLKGEIKSIAGDSCVKSVMISDLKSKKERDIPVDAVFVSMGGVPMTDLIEKTGVAVDDRGCIQVDRRQATNIGGVFAAGDCTFGGMQIVTAVGEGAMAAMQAHRYVRSIKR
ncbi:MAG: NAD(P)/FAD-dependent oxidoreductase, partial [Candidatus Bathyarchaeia archaeon]